MAYIGGRKAVRGRITRGCGIGRPLGMWNSQSNREHGFLFDAASFWTRMTRKAAAYFSEGRRLAGVSRAQCWVLYVRGVQGQRVRGYPRHNKGFACTFPHPRLAELILDLR